jgi:hypothetical protein
MAYQLPTNFTVGNTSTSVDGVGTLLSYANYATSGWLGSAFLLLIFGMVFLMGGSYSSDKKGSFVAASFITFIFSVYFVRIQMANPVIPFALILMTIIGFFMAKDSP